MPTRRVTALRDVVVGPDRVQTAVLALTGFARGLVDAAAVWICAAGEARLPPCCGEVSGPDGFVVPSVWTAGVRARG